MPQRRPIYSKRWLGRHFILSECSWSWGRYQIKGRKPEEISDEAWFSALSAIEHTDLGCIAATFEGGLLSVDPSAHPFFLSEIGTLYTYELAKKHLKAINNGDCSRSDRNCAREAVANAFLNALSAVFNAAEPLHKCKARLVRYLQILNGVHLVSFEGKATMYEVAFTSDLILECIRRDSDLEMVWQRTS